MNEDAVKIPLQFEVTGDNVKSYIRELKAKLKEIQNFADTKATSGQGKKLNKDIASLEQYIKKLKELDLRKSGNKDVASSIVENINSEIAALDNLTKSYETANKAKYEFMRKQMYKGEFGKAFSRNAKNQIDGEISIPKQPAVDNKRVSELSKEVDLTKKLGELSDKEYDSEKKLESLQNSRVQLDKQELLLREKIDALLSKKTKTKEDKSELARLREQYESNSQKRSENTYDRKAEEEKLQLIKDETEELKKQLNLTQFRRDTERVSERSELDMAKISQNEKVVESLQEAIAEADSAIASHTGNIRRNIKMTADEIKLESQKIISALSQQPSKDFTKEENDEIKLLQKNIAAAEIEAKKAAEKVSEPWKLKIDVRDMQAELKQVDKEVADQTAEVERLRLAYKEAEQAASDIANAFKPGEYSPEQLTLEMEKIKGAQGDADRVGMAYGRALAQLDKLVVRQQELSDKIADTSKRAEEMIGALKADDHKAKKVEINEQAYQEYEQAANTVDHLKSELEDVYNTANNNHLMKQEDLDVAKQIEETLKGIGNEVKNIQENDSLLGKSFTFGKSTVANIKKESDAVKNSTAQYYYKLRAVKMLGFVVNQASATVNNFGKTTLKVTGKMLSAYLRLIPGINLVRKALDGAHKSQKKFNAESKKTVKTNGLMNMSFKDLIKNVLKYALGIRSVYVLFNRMRRAIIAGLGEMSKHFDDVNASMSSIATSFAQMKAALTSIIEPIIHVLAPALEKLSALFAQLSYYAASFIAALTGQSMVYKAVRSQIDYAESLDKTAKSAKNAKKELSGLDKLNVLHSKDNNDDDNTGMAWEKVPIDDRMKEWADKFKEFLRKLFAPIKAAWDKWGAWVKASFKKMLNELLGLGKAIADDFWKVWAEPETQKIFENIFHIMGDIALIVAHLAINFRNAWKHNQNGYRILKAIRDIILIITDSLVRMADYTVEWARNLNFIPLLDAVADTLAQKIVPAVRRIMGLVETLYEQIFLNILKKFIEGGLPRLVKMLGKVVEIIGIIADKINFALKSGSNGINTINKISELFDIVADHIDSALDKTKEWAKELDFRVFFKSINDFLDNMKPAIESISSVLENLWTNVLLPFWKYLIDEGFPKLFEKLGKVNSAADWEKITENVNTFVSALEPLFELAWDVLAQLITDVYEAISNLLKSDEFGEIATKFKDFMDNLREDEEAPARIAKKIEDLAVKFAKLSIELGIAAKVILPLITGILTIGNILNTTGMAANISKIASAVGNGASGAGLTGAFSGLAGVIGSIIPIILIVIGVIALMVGAFGGIDELLEEIKERFDKVKEAISQFAEQIGFNDTLDKLKETFSRLGDSMTELRPVFEYIFDILADIATVILETVIGALDGLITAIDGAINFISGIFDVIGGLIEIITALFKGDYAAADNGLATLIEGLGEIFYGLLEFVEGTFDAIAQALAGFVDLVCPDLAKGITDFCNDVKEAFAWLKNVLIGDPIVYDIQDGVESSFSEWISQTASDVGGWVKDRITDFTTLASNIGTTVGEIGTFVKDGFTTLKEGATEKASELVATAKEKFESVKSNAQENFESSKFAQYGKNAVNGIEGGLKAFGTVLSTAAKNANDLRAKFNVGLATKVFTSIGKFIPAGLRAGLAAGLPALLSSVTNMCNQITSRIRSVLQMHSPSKVFKDFGLMMDKGMELGVEDGTKGITDAFEELMPAENTFDSFYDKFLSKMEELTTSVATLFDDMSLHITDVMNSLSNLAAMQNFNDQLASVSKMKVPSIVKGYSLPANAEFKKDKTTSTEIDLSDLPNIIKDAVIEAITSTTDLQTGDETTIINIDGKEVFQVVKDKNTEYKKRHGKSAFV